MSLPIVIIFERHWDLIPKPLVKELLPELSKRGYGNFCFEAPEPRLSSLKNEILIYCRTSLILHFQGYYEYTC